MTAADKSRPAWLPDGCPAWCPYGADHKDSEAYEDRVHSGSTWHLTLTADDPPSWDHPRRGRETDNEPSQLDLALSMHYREVEPRIHLGRNEQRGSYLTLKEAKELADLLLELVRQGAGD